jgi:bifunctional DNA-binding transcriptional regulator/antitoxin component of YhaV-PrlF toxin-antitoxin module
MRESGGLLLVAADRQGVFSVSGQGHVVLPAAVRHWCRLQVGDRVFVVADLGTKVLVVHPPEAVDAMVAHLHETRISEDDR